MQHTAFWAADSSSDSQSSMKPRDSIQCSHHLTAGPRSELPESNAHQIDRQTFIVLSRVPVPSTLSRMSQHSLGFYFADEFLFHSNVLTCLLQAIQTWNKCIVTKGMKHKVMLMAADCNTSLSVRVRTPGLYSTKSAPLKTHKSATLNTALVFMWFFRYQRLKFDSWQILWCQVKRV
jgi:hypothetical protein